MKNIIAFTLTFLFFQCSSLEKHEIISTYDLRYVQFNKGDDTQINQSLMQEFDGPIAESGIRRKIDISSFPFHSGDIKRVATDPLPQIDSIIYHKLDTRFDANFNRTQRLKNLKKYNNKLPKLGEYEVYYSEFNCAIEQEKALNEICNSYGNLMCGFLIFYNSKTKNADVINIRNSYYIDAGIDLNFTVKNNYEIHLNETEMTDDEDGGSLETYFSNQYNVLIGKNNTLEVRHSPKE